MQFVQGTQRIEVVVKRESGGGTGKQGAKEKTADEVTAKQEDEQEQQGFARKRFIKTNVTHGIAVAKQVIDLGIEYQLSGLGYKTGDSAYQDIVNRQVEVFKDAGNVLSSIAIGATYGSAGGPVGAVLGACFAAISTSASLASKYAGRERDFSYKAFKAENAIEYKRARASINLTTGRLR